MAEVREKPPECYSLNSIPDPIDVVSKNVRNCLRRSVDRSVDCSAHQKRNVNAARQGEKAYKSRGPRQTGGQKLRPSKIRISNQQSGSRE